MATMEHQSPVKVLSTPGTPLHQVSQERMNQQRIPQSPSLHSYLSENERPHHRDSVSSDVQAKVAFLNGLSGQNSPTRQPRGTGNTPSHAAFQRAILGYEESQASLASVNSELERLRDQVRSGQKRERLVAERVESLMQQLHHERERRTSDKNAYVAEIKKCRKQTYQAELGQVEVREELKQTKAELKRLASEMTHEKTEKDKARQEAFERAYAVAGMTEELEVLREKAKAAEKGKEAAVLELHAATISKRDLLAIPESTPQPASRRTQDVDRHLQHIPNSHRHMEDPDRTPRATLPDHLNSTASRWIPGVVLDFSTMVREMALVSKQMDGEPLTMQEQVEMLQMELREAKKKNMEHEETIHLMNMECQFNACACRDAERRGFRFVHDYVWDNKVREQHHAKKRKLEEDEKFNQLPPEPTSELVIKSSEQPDLEEAVQVPLPEPESMELDSPETSPDATAQLEEITQVMVESGTATEPFTFSASTSSHSHFRNTAPTLRQAQSATQPIEAGLFDLSPPKHTPVRPSTALGVMTLPSPIRLVADSPQLTSLPARSHTPMEDLTFSHSSTTRVPLKESPAHQHRRAHSRPNIRSQSRTRSPLVNAVSNTDFSKSTSASPAATTLFPVTPVVKHARSLHALASQAYPQTVGAITTATTITTTIPLRGLEADDVFSPARPVTGFSSSTMSDTTGRGHELVPGTPVSREAALAQIRARRDRARSVNLKKDNGNGVKSAPGSAKRGLTLRDGTGHALAHGGLERGRDISQASAPGRFDM